MSGKGIQKKSFSFFLRWWWGGEGDGVEVVRKSCKEQVVKEFSLRFGDVGVLEVNIYEERRNLVGIEGWRVRFMGSEVIWFFLEKKLNLSMDEYVGNLLGIVDKLKSQRKYNVEIMRIDI